ncbi:MAG: aminodeoxychorismate/anthranilate synthase component II [Proteobacteria bacterium]|nr:aminodeoxychorismate/anthranilate synthase component II [Pseudomonadota bacterium]
MILLIDNYDSFTFNLYQYLGELGEDIEVFRNDKITLEEIQTLQPEKIVLSPGPGRPDQAGIMIDLIGFFADTIPILGICLGFQAIGEAFGGKIVHAPELFHGKTSRIRHVGTGIFEGILQNIPVARYHSLILERSSLPDCFQITSWTEDDLIMGIRHKTLPVEGIQFHPESILTPEGKRMLARFLQD